jgi:protein phosphatase
MKFTIPELSLVILIGASGSGKSTFAHQHFKPTEILSSDICRGLVSDNENDQSVTKDAFEVLHFIARKRLAAGRLTVIDATNVQAEARKPLLTLAREYHTLPVAIVLNLPERICQDRNRSRPDRNFGPHVIRNQVQDLRQSLRNLEREGFRHVIMLDSLEAIETVTIEREPLWNNRKHEHGPFDIIGDVHGCFDELIALLQQLGYQVTPTFSSEPEVENGFTTKTADSNPISYTVSHPTGRKVIFLGDLVDRGPQTPAVLRLVMDMVQTGVALCVPGNHDMKLMRKLKGKQVQITHGLAESLAQLESEPTAFKQQIVSFIDKLVSHYILDEGKLVVAHAGLKESLQGRGSGAVRDFALYGETTGETDEFGLPVRYNWAAEYRGKAMVIYGHTPVPKPEWLNHTICIDTGCVYGGKLTALRYPEKELVAVQAAKIYYDSPKPLQTKAETSNPTMSMLSVQQQQDDILDIEDVLGKRLIDTQLRPNIVIREENSIAALEVISRFAANPKWLIYLPPTMSPSETSKLPTMLEQPSEAFAYYRNEGVAQVVCEEKHMGSRSIVIVCQNVEAAHKHFGVIDEGIGICYTRTGRRFFDNPSLENEFLDRVRAALDSTNFWAEFKTEWVILDCELMPWSAKAQDLLRRQYAAVGTAAQVATKRAVTSIEETLNQLSKTRAENQNSPQIEAMTALLERYQSRVTITTQYIKTYQHYCWSVNSVADLKLAPFHLLATEGQVWVNQNHEWHMQTLAKICAADPILMLATPYKLIDLTDPTSEATGIAWWQELTARGGEGIVVKPLDFIAKGVHGLLQPAIKCRGREYLRIIYGPEYTMPENLERLRTRSLAAKRSLALREFALGIEALERFVQHEPLRRVHECIFGVLALESEPIDPRL